ncbi:MAG: hypothetical protein PHY54_19280 [Methylococcales bacterium]|nr:hypothetical protein [Methylococcales bacterium]
MSFEADVRVRVMEKLALVDSSRMLPGFNAKVPINLDALLGAARLVLVGGRLGYSTGKRFKDAWTQGNGAVNTGRRLATAGIGSAVDAMITAQLGTVGLQKAVHDDAIRLGEDPARHAMNRLNANMRDLQEWAKSKPSGVDTLKHLIEVPSAVAGWALKTSPGTQVGADIIGATAGHYMGNNYTNNLNRGIDALSNSGAAALKFLRGLTAQVK